MAEFTMPALGADMTEGTLVEWLVRPGDTVARGDIVAVVDTAKAAIEVECYQDGTVESLLVEPGTTVPVGAPLAAIATSPPGPRTAEPEDGRKEAAATTGTGPPAPTAPPTTPLVRQLAQASGVDLATVHGTGPGGRITRTDVADAAPARTGNAEPTTARVRATPMARRLAAESGVDLATVHGTGQNGTVRAADVRDAAKEPGSAAAVAPPRPKDTGKKSADRAASMRRAVGNLMARSKREIPHYYLSTTIDLSAALAWLHDRNRGTAVAERLVPAALLFKAAALAAREVPELNGFWTADGFVPAPAVHLGVAVSLRGGGLVAPAVHDAADLPLADLMAHLRDLVARARAGRLRAAETTDPTITVTSLGEQGVEAVFGVVYPPQVALLGLGKVVERPWAADGMLGVRPLVTATLSADHRASDGAIGSRYLSALDRLLQSPEEL
ncbi:dehydrogenase [Kitasatospora griseola]|uniref:Dihydrolipoamide acetyltransferase component of pyruvate dehydrogenase complex n=1 Tax=Kitasatospora griseola TaxID=2064 RepID=A0A0D0PUG0_KITGR|nr:dihydrolipoamide acetyltransferase family protein [Kitasatospora griseola]KIQ66159.1 dehydrogenase [Kitasatospora griseola]